MGDEISREEDWKLKLKCLEIAAIEHIELVGRLTDMDSVFTRTRDLYDKAHEESMFDWKSPFLKKSVASNAQTQKPTGQKPDIGKLEKETTNPQKEMPKDGEKICPDCGEAIPEGWKKHSFKKDGSKCGHMF
jgi:hypothetical protein